MSQFESILSSIVQPKRQKLDSNEIKRRKKKRRNLRLKEAKASLPKTWNAGSPLKYDDLLSVEDEDLVSLERCYETVQVKLSVAMYNEKRQKSYTTKSKKGCIFARSDGYDFAVRCGLSDECKYSQRFRRQEVLDDADALTYALVC